MLKKIILMMVTLSSTNWIFADINNPTPNDFAYGYKMNVNTTNATQSVDLPIEIFNDVQPNFSDIMVFNALGEKVPFFIRQVNYQDEENSKQEYLPFFPLFGTQETELSQNVVIENGNITIKNSPQNPNAVLSAYLLDNTKHPEGYKLSKLIFSFADYENFLSQFRIEMSDDLANWETLLPNAVVSRLTHNDEIIEVNEINLPVTTAKYLRITRLQKNAALFQLSNVQGVYEKKHREILSNHYLVNDAIFDDTKKSIYFTTPKSLPLSGIKITFKTPNNLLRGSLKSLDENKEWHEITTISQYRLQENNQPILSKPDKFFYYGNARPAASWKIDITESYWSSAKEIDAIDLEWSPVQLLFIARGEGPFTLAYGNPIFTQLQSADSSLFSEKNMTPASLGEKIELGGTEKLVPPFPWQRVVLFSILGLGLLLLAWMAMRLFKDVNKPANE